jgi:Type II secretion system (T2SS), protein E, N-terminal domain
MNVRKRLGELLIEAGAIEEPQLQVALAHQRKWGGKLGQALVDLNLASEAQIVGALSRKLGYEIVDVAALQRTPALEEALKLVPSDVAVRQTVLPIESDPSSLTVAMSDPSNIAVVDELAFRTGRRIKITLAGDRAVSAAVQRFYFGDDDRRGGVLHRVTAARAVEPAAPPVLAATRPAPRDPAPRREPPPAEERKLTPREAALLDAVQRALRGQETPLVKPGQLLGAFVRVAVRKGLVTELELVEELARQGGG